MFNQVSLPDEVEYILKRLSVPPRLYAHLLLVHDVAYTLIKAITGTWDNLNIDEDLILFGAATHDIGKCIHINELKNILMNMIFFLYWIVELQMMNLIRRVMKLQS